MDLPRGVEVTGPSGERFEEVLTPDALEFLALLHRTFNSRRVELLVLRDERQAIGGMAAFIRSRPDPQVNAAALAKVREDKTRGAGDGFDGSWVAHPDLVPVCRELVERLADEEIAKLDGDATAYTASRALFMEVAVADHFVDFLTLPAYERTP